MYGFSAVGTYCGSNPTCPKSSFRAQIAKYGVQEFAAILLGRVARREIWPLVIAHCRAVERSRKLRRTTRPGTTVKRPVHFLLTIAFAARERIAVRNRAGETVTVPLAAPRPEVDRFQRRCEEIAPTLPEADAPRRASGSGARSGA